MTGESIIKEFRTYVDDGSELSLSEEIKLLNKKYNELANDRPWEWCRTLHTAAITPSDTYIDLPDTFRYFMPDPELDAVGFWLGTSFYPIYPYAQRRARRGQAYIDNNRLYLPENHRLTGTIEMDICIEPDAFTLANYATMTPAFRNGFHSILTHMMALDFAILDQMEAAFSKEEQNKTAYNNYYEDMALEDAEKKDFDYAS